MTELSRQDLTDSAEPPTDNADQAPTGWRDRLTMARGGQSIVTVLATVWGTLAIAVVVQAIRGARAWSLLPGGLRATAEFWAPYLNGNAIIAIGVIGVALVCMLNWRSEPIAALAAGGAASLLVALALVMDLRCAYAIVAGEAVIQPAEPWLASVRSRLDRYEDRGCTRTVRSRLDGGRYVDNRLVYVVSAGAPGEGKRIDLGWGVSPDQVRGFVEAMAAGGALQARWTPDWPPSAHPRPASYRPLVQFSPTDQECLAHFSAGLDAQRAEQLRALITPSS